ncbi:MAG: DUF5659 domain-containing protein [Candidatus Staskawiczbacteria bacterium]|nr:DUF5659 domain-containing protein [Candidatus Staskawiczbacteria bacterium]
MKDFEYLNSEDHIEISDLALVSALQCLGFSIVAFNHDPKDLPKVKMILKKSKELEEAVKNFFDGSLLVEPKSYWNAIREIKSRIRMN